MFMEARTSSSAQQFKVYDLCFTREFCFALRFIWTFILNWELWVDWVTIFAGVNRCESSICDAIHRPIPPKYLIVALFSPTICSHYKYFHLTIQSTFISQRFSSDSAFVVVDTTKCFELVQLCLFVEWRLDVCLPIVEWNSVRCHQLPASSNNSCLC